MSESAFDSAAIIMELRVTLTELLGSDEDDAGVHIFPAADLFVKFSNPGWFCVRAV